METKDLFNYFKKMPLWLKLAVAIVLAVAFALTSSSCSNTKAVVRASSENTQASVTITTNNPTSVTVSNKQDTVGLQFNPKK